MRPIVAALALATLAGTQRAVDPSLDVLLERFGAYLTTYEDELSAVVADEIFEQRANIPRGRASFLRRRTLESTVSFMRLPGGSAWLGMREVRRIDKKPVAGSDTLMALLVSPEDDLRKRAAALALASAAHNLGNPRTINMPTLPLDLLHPRNRERMSYQLGGHASVRGTKTMRLVFEERGAPTLIRSGDDGRWLISRGVASVDPVSGALWRAQVYYRDYLPALRYGHAPEAQIRVEFGPNTAVGILVPIEMREVFAAEPGLGQGRARYSNYRRFGTSARIIPQP
jgi:hypothetical protein